MSGFFYHFFPYTMKSFFIRIVWQKPLSIDLKIEEIRKCPTHSTKCFHFKEELIRVDYHPSKVGFDELVFREQMLKSAKRQFPGKIMEATIFDTNPLLTS